MNKLIPVVIFILLVSFSSLSLAQADIGLKGVGGRIGFIMPEDPIDNTLGFGLNADLGTITPSILLHAYLDYWAKSYDVGYYGWTWSAIGIAAIAKYKIEMEGSLKPYVGGGLGLNISKISSEYKGPQSDLWGQYSPSVSESNSDLAIHLVAGAAMALSPQMDGFAEIKYTIDGADNFGIFVGVNYKLK